jgi:hypothetical protein
MNEMIEIKQKPGESVWEVDQKFKRLKCKLNTILLICSIDIYLLTLYWHT